MIENTVGGLYTYFVFLKYSPVTFKISLFIARETVLSFENVCRSLHCFGSGLSSKRQRVDYYLGRYQRLSRDRFLLCKIFFVISSVVGIVRSMLRSFIDLSRYFIPGMVKGKNFVLREILFP